MRAKTNLGTVERIEQVDTEDQSLLEGSSIGRLDFLRQLGLTLLAATGLFGVASVFAGEARAHSGCVPRGCVKCCHRCCINKCAACPYSRGYACIQRIVRYTCGPGRCEPRNMQTCRHCVLENDPNGRCDTISTCGSNSPIC